MKFKNFDLTLGPSLSTSTNSVSQNIDYDFGFSVQIVFTGSSLDGSFKLQASNDNTNWTDVTSSTAVSSLTGTSSIMYNVDAAYYNYFRVSWTRTGGTGTANSCKATIKGG